MNVFEYGVGLDIVLFFHAWFQPFNAWLWKILHTLGGGKGFLLVVPIIFLAMNKTLGIRLFVLILSSAVIMNTLKLFFARPRPFEVAPELFVRTVNQSGFGLPSGHVWLSLVFVGFLAYAYPLKRNVVIAMLWVGLMAVSRMVLGVHYPQDVIVGALLGGLNLWLFIKWYAHINQWFVAKIFLTQTLYIIVFLLFIQLLAVLLHQEFDYRKSLFASSGVLAGGGFGLLLAARYVKFDVPLCIKAKIMRSVVGLALLVCFYGLISLVYGNLFNDPQALLSNVFYQVKYALIGWWATFAVPWILVKFK